MKCFITLLFLFTFTLACAFSPVDAIGADKSNLEQRIKKLEKRVKKLRKKNRKIEKSSDYQNKLKKLDEKTERIQKILEEIENESMDDQDNMLSDLVKISGYADAELRITNSKNANNRFRMHHLSLFFSKRVQKKWQFFSEIEFEDAPVMESIHVTDNADTIQGKVLIEQVYIEYKPQLGLELRFGRFLTPAGIWNIFHYYPYLPTQTRPIFIRKIFPEFSDGVQVRRAFTIGTTMFDAHLYMANGEGNPGRLDRNNEKAVGARLNLSKDVLDGLDAGISYFRDFDNNKSLNNSYAAHLKLNHREYRLQSEFALRNNSPDTSSNFYNIGAYVQLSYDLKKWTFAGRYDWYDPNNKISDNDQARYTGALNYHFAHNVIGKIEYNVNEFSDPLEDDFNELITSIVIAIGDL